MKKRRKRTPISRSLCYRGIALLACALPMWMTSRAITNRLRDGLVDVFNGTLVEDSLGTVIMLDNLEDPPPVTPDSRVIGYAKITLNNNWEPLPRLLELRWYSNQVARAMCSPEPSVVISPDDWRAALTCAKGVAESRYPGHVLSGVSPTLMVSQERVWSALGFFALVPRACVVALLVGSARSFVKSARETPRERRRRRGECPACGYSMAGITEGVCPECGDNSFSQSESRT